MFKPLSPYITSKHRSLDEQRDIAWNGVIDAFNIRDTKLLFSYVKYLIKLDNVEKTKYGIKE